MVILGHWNQRSLTISVKNNCLTVSLQGPRHVEVFSFDYAGRLWTAMLEGVSYRRGLDGKMVAKWQDETGERQRRWIQPEQAREIEERVRCTMVDLFADINRGKAPLEVPLDEQAVRGFEQAIRFDRERSQVDAGRYFQVYKPVGILPPDQYMAVVLQATEGCAFNTCTYCTFFRDRRFRIKNPEEFHQHAEAVKDYIGAGMSLRRTIFLGDANALIAPMGRLLPLLEVVHDVYDVEQLGGIYAFLDGFSGEKKSGREYAMLADRGLERAYIGMESGNAPLLSFLKKPGRPADAVQAVKAMKAGSVAVGVIVLLGAGGQVYARGHVNDTIQALNAMNLGAEDIVYFSELITDEDMPYVKDAYQAHLQPLTAEERIAQGEAIERGLKFSRRRGTPMISRYDIREFVY